MASFLYKLFTFRNALSVCNVRHFSPDGRLLFLGRWWVTSRCTSRCQEG